MPVHADTYLYHDPCHTPLRLNPPLETVKKLTGANVVQSERCCGESGLFAVKRPDIASQVRHRKFEEIEKARAKAGIKGHVKMLTTCPGCLQGLSRYEERADMDAEYIVVEMARQICAEYGCKKVASVVRNISCVERSIWMGMLFDAESGEHWFSPAHDVHVLEGVAAGDAFNAGLVHALINDFDPQDAVNYAIAASILKLTIKGDSNLVTAGEIASVASAADGGTRVAR